MKTFDIRFVVTAPTGGSFCERTLRLTWEPQGFLWWLCGNPTITVEGRAIECRPQDTLTVTLPLTVTLSNTP